MGESHNHIEVMIKVEKLLGDAVVVVIPAWKPEQQVVIPAERFPLSLKSTRLFPVWYRGAIMLHAHYAGDLDIQDIKDW